MTTVRLSECCARPLSRLDAHGWCATCCRENGWEFVPVEVDP